MIHRFIDIEDEIRPDIPFIAVDNTNNTYVIWQMGNLATPRGINAASVSVFSGDWIADPMASPVRDSDDIPVEFVYCKVRAGTGPVNELIVVDWEGTNANIITTSEGNNGTRGISTSLMPSWSPDGQQIVFCDTIADHINTDEPRNIRVIDRDGANETIILIGSNIYTPTYAESDTFWNPQYSYDGSKIAFVRERGVTDTGTPSNSGTYTSLEVMNPDGTGLQTVAGPLHASGLSRRLIAKSFGWANTSMVLTYMTFDGFAASDDQFWRKVNSDGTGAAVVWQIDRAGRTTFDLDSFPIKWSWLSDDSAIVAAIADYTGTGLTDIVLLDPAGSGPTVLVKDASDDSTDEDARPVAMPSGSDDGAGNITLQPRVFFPANSSYPITYVDSVLEDGTDRRTDDNADVDEFDGFQGDPLT